MTVGTRRTWLGEAFIVALGDGVALLQFVRIDFQLLGEDRRLHAHRGASSRRCAC